MLSKKMLRLTLISLLAQVIYMSVGDIPEYLIRPLLIVGVMIGTYCLYLYTTGSFTEEKVVEKITQHRDEPLADLHMPSQVTSAKKEETKEELVGDSVTNT